jgi:hypothetical protein
MKDKNDTKTPDLFPSELIVTRLFCTSTALKRGKEETRVNMRFEGYTNARFETDLCNDDYLNAAGELLVRLCCEDSTMARKYLSMIEEKYTIEQLCDANAGAKKPVVSGGNIGMMFSTAVDFDIECIIVEKPTLIKLVAMWLLMLAKGDSYAASCAINTGYLRLVNSDDAIFQAGDVTVSAYQHAAH